MMSDQTTASAKATSVSLCLKSAVNFSDVSCARSSTSSGSLESKTMLNLTTMGLGAGSKHRKMIFWCITARQSVAPFVADDSNGGACLSPVHPVDVLTRRRQTAPRQP
jgi:hypothetical protein